MNRFIFLSRYREVSYFKHRRAYNCLVIRNRQYQASTTEDVTAIRNVEQVQVGLVKMQPWYFSPYQPHIYANSCIYLCAFCLTPFPNRLMQFQHFVLITDFKAYFNLF